jgi:membrane-associated phospholipid phosphatase
MNPILDWGINLIAGFQTALPWLKAPMQFFSFLGQEEFFFIFLPLLYWCVDAGLGIRVGVILTLSNSANSLFKWMFHQPRPYWVSDRVLALSHETSYGLPSGHAQHAASIWGVVGAHGQTWLRWAMGALIFFIGLSRIFLAVHFPTDVIAGWLIGGVLLWLFLKWERPVLAWFNRFTLAQKIGLVFAASMLLLVLPLIGLAFVPPADPPAWAVNEPNLAPRDTTGLVGVVGTFFGLATGALLLFHQGGLDTRREWWKLAARFVIGVIGVLILWLGLRQVFPRDAALVAQALRYLRYAVAGFWVAYGAPWVFIRLRL